MYFNLHHAYFDSCIGLGSSAWPFACLIISLFHMASNVYSLALHTRLGLLHLIVHGLV